MGGRHGLPDKRRTYVAMARLLLGELMGDAEVTGSVRVLDADPSWTSSMITDYVDFEVMLDVIGASRRRRVVIGVPVVTSRRMDASDAPRLYVDGSSWMWEYARKTLEEHAQISRCSECGRVHSYDAELL